MKLLIPHPLLAFTTASAIALLALSACGDDTSNNSGSGGQGGALSGGQGGAGGDDSGAGGSGGDSSGNGGNGGNGGTFNPGSGGGDVVLQYPELWYSVADRLVHMPLNPADGSVASFQQSTIQNPPPLGQNLLTMMPDGSLIGGRLSNADNKTYFYHIPEPPRDGSAISIVELGVMIEDLMLEGMYTDCEGRLYGMDTGSDVGSSAGNRLLRFTGDFLASDFSYAVVSDLSTATVADIDDMGPGISNNEISDNPGLAIDSGTVHAFDYETGSGTQVGTGGTWGIHALGGGLFDDGVARLFLLDSTAQLFEMNPTSYTLSPVLGTGPTDVAGLAGHSGLAGPLTNCNSGFTPPN